jgi:hypothetical protein
MDQAGPDEGFWIDHATVLTPKLAVYSRWLYTIMVAQAEDGTLTRSKAELVADSGISISSVKRALRELTENGVIEVELTKNSSGDYRTSTYTLMPLGGRSCENPPPVKKDIPAAQWVGPVRTNPKLGGSCENPGGRVSEDVGSVRTHPFFIEEQYESEDAVSVSKPLNDEEQDIHSTKPAPAPEEPTALINFNNIDIPTQTTAPKKARTRAAKPTSDPDFDRAWEAYDHKPDKTPAFKAWLKALSRTDAETIIAAIPAYVAVTSKRGEPEGRGADWKPRRKNFSTWLNADGWADEIEMPKTGYQGRAGSDARAPEEYVNFRKQTPIVRLLRNGPASGDWEMSYAWYYHWNRDEQADWTVEQMLATGNTPEDVDILMDAYINGIEPVLYQRFLDEFSLSETDEA